MLLQPMKSSAGRPMMTLVTTSSSLSALSRDSAIRPPTSAPNVPRRVQTKNAVTMVAVVIAANAPRVISAPMPAPAFVLPTVLGKIAGMMGAGEAVVHAPWE